MIYAIFIVDKDSGFPLVERIYRDMGMESELISAFISALWILLENTMKVSDEAVKSEMIADSRWAYLKDRRLLFVAITVKDYNPRWLEEQLQYIRNLFFERYPEMNNKMDEILNTSKGDNSRWSEFTNELDELVKNWEESNKRAYVAQILDLLEIYQQLIVIISKELDTESRNLLAKKINELASKFNITLRREGTPLNFKDQIDYYNASYNDVRLFLMRLFDEAFKMLKENKDQETFVNIIRSRMYPIVKREIARIDIYDLEKNIYPKIFI